MCRSDLSLLDFPCARLGESSPSVVILSNWLAQNRLSRRARGDEMTPAHYKGSSRSRPSASCERDGCKTQRIVSVSTAVRGPGSGSTRSDVRLRCAVSGALACETSFSTHDTGELESFWAEMGLAFRLLVLLRNRARLAIEACARAPEDLAFRSSEIASACLSFRERDKPGELAASATCRGSFQKPPSCGASPLGLQSTPGRSIFFPARKLSASRSLSRLLWATYTYAPILTDLEALLAGMLKCGVLLQRRNPWSAGGLPKKW